MYKTGNLCPQSGWYSFVKHTDTSICMSKHEEIISLDAFERFPITKECKSDAFWVLLNNELAEKYSKHKVL
jgi:hypothetical protein